jgi:hypothetical protein
LGATGKAGFINQGLELPVTAGLSHRCTHSIWCGCSTCQPLHIARRGPG